MSETDEPRGDRIAKFLSRAGIASPEFESPSR